MNMVCTWCALLGLTHWGRVTHICVSKQTSIGSDNGFSPGRHQAIIRTDAGILLIGPLGTNFSEISIEIHILSFKKMHLKMSSGKWWPFCLGLNVFSTGRFYLYDILHHYLTDTGDVMWLPKSQWINPGEYSDENQKNSRIEMVMFLWFIKCILQNKPKCYWVSQWLHKSWAWIGECVCTIWADFYYCKNMPWSLKLFLCV